MSFNQVEARVLARERVSVSVPAQTAIGAVAAQIVGTNPARRGLIVQNTGTTTVYLALGGGSPTATVYHVALKACANGDDGSGGIYLDDAWQGAVQAIGSAPGGTLVLTEIS